jgi:hypothetical protein
MSIGMLIGLVVLLGGAAFAFAMAWMITHYES